MKLSDYQQDLYLKWVASVEYTKMGEKTTVVLVTLNNGFELVGTSACVDPKNFDFVIGKHYALVDALLKLEEFDGFFSQYIGNK